MRAIQHGDSSRLVTHHRVHLDWLSKRLAVETFQDWYKVSTSSIRKNGGIHLLAEYKYSLFDLLQSSFPEFTWNRLLFQRVPRNYWKDPLNGRILFDWIAETLSIESQEDWYSLNSSTVEEVAGDGILRHFDYSLLRALQNVYPEFEWNQLLFPHVPRHYWKRSSSSERQLLDWTAEELKIQRQQDWYRINSRDLQDSKGGRLLQQYGGSILSLLQNVYPEYEWSPWPFNVIPLHFWNDERNRKKCIEWMEEQLQIEDFHQWLSFSKQQVVEIGGGSLLQYHGGSLLNAISSIYPELLSSAVKLAHGHNQLLSFLRMSLNEDLLVNYTFKRSSGTVLEFDIYLPSLCLALEYQGQMHYSSKYHQGSLRQRQQRTELKNQTCKQLGITMIEVPFWWQSSLPTLIRSIQRIRPDIQFTSLGEQNK